MALRDDLRQLDIPGDFEGGNNRQRQKLNAALKCLRDIKAAADRDAGAAAEQAAQQTITLKVFYNGGIVSRTFVVV